MHPFSGSGASGGRDLKKICTGATVERGLAIRGCETARSEQKIAQWAKGFV